jgi:hypothetical protein
MLTIRERCPGERIADEVVSQLLQKQISAHLSLPLPFPSAIQETGFRGELAIGLLRGSAPLFREMCVLSAAIVVIAGLLFGLLVIWMLVRAVQLVFYSKKGGFETDKRLWSLQ